MAKETALRLMVYAATSQVIGAAVLWAFVVIPRLAMDLEATADGVVRSNWLFFIIQLMAAAVLLAFIIRSWHGGRKIVVDPGSFGHQQEVRQENGIPGPCPGRERRRSGLRLPAPSDHRRRTGKTHGLATL